jgi:predicted  nucleic acid-binding Zn-ribbon protein
MNKELERVIALQQLDSATHEAQRRLADEPERRKAFEAREQAARERVAADKERLAASQSARREFEKEVAVHQGRLSKFRDQLMAVKTNQEYQAMQKEMAFAQTEIKAIEDKVLERMLEADELAAELKRAEANLGKELKEIEADRRVLESETAELKTSVERIAGQRTELVRALDPRVFAIFDLVSSRRNGIGVAEAREGICTICHVRLRPQVFNTVRRNDEIVQCDSCQRILYFTPPPPQAAPADRAGQPAR